MNFFCFSDSADYADYVDIDNFSDMADFMILMVLLILLFFIFFFWFLWFWWISDLADSDDFTDFALINMGWVGWGGNICVHRFYRALSLIINVIVWKGLLDIVKLKSLSLFISLIWTLSNALLLEMKIESGFSFAMAS